MDLLLDSTGDLYFGDDARFAMTSSTAELVAQRLKLRLDSQRGSWFLDETWGVRYIDTDGDDATILVKNPNIIAIVSELKSIIASVEGVNRITSFESQFSSSARSFAVEFTVEADDGEVDATILIGDGASALYDPDGAAIAVLDMVVRSACLV